MQATGRRRRKNHQPLQAASRLSQGIAVGAQVTAEGLHGLTATLRHDLKRRVQDMQSFSHTLGHKRDTRGNYGVRFRLVFYKQQPFMPCLSCALILLTSPAFAIQCWNACFSLTLSFSRRWPYIPLLHKGLDGDGSVDLFRLLFSLILFSLSFTRTRFRMTFRQGKDRSLNPQRLPNNSNSGTCEAYKSRLMSAQKGRERDDGM